MLPNAPTRRALRALLLAVLLPLAGAAMASTPAPGLALESADDGSRRSVLVRRDAGGRPDLRFGDGGRVLLDGLRARRVVADARGNLLVVGSTTGSPPQPAVLRLTPNGQRDPAWGPQGLSSAAPPAGPAVVIDAVPLGDGRTLLFGEVGAPVSRAALWTMDAGGRFDPRWLLHTDALASRALALAAVDGGPRLMLALAAAHRAGDAVEGHAFMPALGSAELPERLVRQSLPREWTATPVLVRNANRWWWSDPGRPDVKRIRARASDETDKRALWAWQTGSAAPAAVAAAAVAPAAVRAEPPPAESGATAFSPFTPRPQAARPAAAPPEDGHDTALWMSALLLAVALFGIARLALHHVD